MVMDTESVFGFTGNLENALMAFGWVHLDTTRNLCHAVLCFPHRNNMILVPLI